MSVVDIQMMVLMVVVDNAKNLIGSHVNLEVVSLLQTSSGELFLLKKSKIQYHYKNCSLRNKIDIKKVYEMAKFVI